MLSGSGSDSLGDRKGLTLFQGCVSVTNILVGIGLLSMPYAVSLSGTVGIFIIALCCLLFNSSGKFIAWGLDLLPDSNSSYFKPHCTLKNGSCAQGYPELGEAAFGVKGRRLVTVAAATELFGGSCMMFIILCRSLQQLLPAHIGSLPLWLPVDAAAIALAVLIEAPICIWGSLKSLSSIAAAGVVSTGVVTALVVALPFVDPEKEWVEDNEHRVIGSMDDVFSATNIMALSVAGHSCFPSVRASMADPKQFPAALNIAYLVICAIVCGVGGVGYWYWGDSAQVLVTDDFAWHSPYATMNVFGFGIRHIVYLLVALNVATTLPLLVMPLEDILMSIVHADTSVAAQETGDLEEPLLNESAAQTGMHAASTSSNIADVASGDLAANIADGLGDITVLSASTENKGSSSSSSSSKSPPKPNSLGHTKSRIIEQAQGCSSSVPVDLKPSAGLLNPVDTSMHVNKRSILEGKGASASVNVDTSAHSDFVRSEIASTPLDSWEDSIAFPSHRGTALPLLDNKAFLLDTALRGRLVRAAIVAVIVTVATLARTSLQSVESVVGAVCAVFSSLLMPTLFYLRIRQKTGKVGPGLWAGGGFIFMFGGCIMTLIIIQTVFMFGMM